MKKILSLIALVAMFSGCTTPDTENKSYGVYNTVRYAKDGDISTGEWTSQYTKARAYAVRHQLPMIFFWGNNGCGICNNAERSMGQADFVAWQKSVKCVFAFTVNGAVGGAEATRMKNDLGSVPTYPGVGFYWPKGGVDSKSYDAKMNGSMTGSMIIQKANEVFGGK